MSFMGVDIGMTGCKAIAFDVEGKVAASDYKEYPIISCSPGWAELDAKVVIDSCKKCIARVVSLVKSTDPVVSIAVSSQGEAFTVVDVKGDYLCNAMVSFDRRSQKQLSELTAQLSEEILYKITGHSPHTMFSLFKLAWMSENTPEVLEKADKIFCFEDLLGFELTGEAVIDFSLAARTMLFDIHKENWSQPILDKIGLKESLLPRPVPSGQIIGKIKRSLCQELGLSAETLVVAGGHDQPCGALGAGVIESHIASYATGTVECITPAFDKLLLNDTLRRSNLATYSHVVEGLYITLAFNLTGGNLLRWFRDKFGGEEVKEAGETEQDPYDLIMKQVAAEPTNIMVLPHFTATGTPYYDSNSAGAIIGLGLTSSRGQFIRALLEGVTYEMRLNIEILAAAGIEITELRTIGGGAKSDTWMQIKSDIIGLPVVSMQTSEAACLGAAMLGAIGCGELSSIEEVAKLWVKPKRTFEPCNKNIGLYNQRYDIYKDLYETIKPISGKLAKLI